MFRKIVSLCPIIFLAVITLTVGFQTNTAEARGTTVTVTNPRGKVTTVDTNRRRPTTVLVTPRRVYVEQAPILPLRYR